MIIQAENDMGDMSEAFQDMTNAMQDERLLGGKALKKEGMDQIRQNLIIRRVDSLTGKKFVEYLEHAIDQNKSDIVFVDPMLAYVGNDVSKQDIMSEFLRVQINPILRRTGVLLFWVHHTGKPGGQANGYEKTSEQKKYSGLGSSDIQNTMREVITLSDEGNGVYKLDFGKRGRRLGIKNDEGKTVTAFNIQHHKDGIIWSRCAGAMSTANKKTAKALQDIETVANYIAKNKTVSKETLMSWAPTVGIGQNAAVTHAKALSDERCHAERREDEKPVIYKDVEETGQKGNRPMVFTVIPPEYIKRRNEVASAAYKDEQNEAKDQHGEEQTEFAEL